jgi:plastocyanin
LTFGLSTFCTDCVRHATSRLLAGGVLIILPIVGSTRADAQASRAGTGRIEGEVVVSRALSSRRPRFRIYADPGPGSRPPAVETNEIRNVVLYLRDDPAFAHSTASAAPARIAQRDEQFQPHIVPVLRGATVEFPNEDDVFHNVFSLSSAKTFDLGRYPKGSSKSVEFDRSGVVQLFCHIHSDMSAVVLVLDDPFFAVPTETGRYVIDGVPAGDYTVIGWHERIRPVERTVHVVAGQTSRVDFNIPIPAGESAAGH